MGVICFEDKKMIIIYDCIGAKRRGCLIIPNDVIRIRFGITDKEQMIYLTEYATDTLDISKELL